MKKPRKVWTILPEKNPKPSMPDSVKTALAAKSIDLIETVLKPMHVLPVKPDGDYNYLMDIGVKWYRNYFYFFSIYACPGPNAISPTFESKFARMEYVGGDRFDLSFHRHTGEWFRIHESLTDDECLKLVQDDPWFRP